MKDVLRVKEGFPGGTSSKEPACQCRRPNRRRFNPWVGKIPLEEGMATHCSILAWRIPWTEEPGRLQSIRSDTIEVTYQAQSTYEYPKEWDELWSVIVETTDVKDKSEYGFAE